MRPELTGWQKCEKTMIKSSQWDPVFEEMGQEQSGWDAYSRHSCILPRFFLPLLNIEVELLYNII